MLLTKKIILSLIFIFNAELVFAQNPTFLVNDLKLSDSAPEIIDSRESGIRPLLEITRLDSKEPRYSMELRDIELVDFFRVVAHDYNLNVVLDREVEGAVRASFTNITMEEALERVASLYNLRLEKQGDVIFVKPNIMTKVFQLKNITVQDLLRQHIEIRRLLEEAGLEGMQKEARGSNAKADADILRKDETASAKEDMSKSQSEAASSGKETKPVRLASNQDVTRTIGGDSLFGRASSIYDLLSEKGKIFVSSQANILMVKDYPANVAMVEEFLKIVDRKIAYQVFNLKYISVKELFPELQIEEKNQRQWSRDERQTERSEIREIKAK